MQVGAEEHAAMQKHTTRSILPLGPIGQMTEFAGSLIGGFLGAHYGRRLSPNVLRAVIVVVGLIGLYRLLTV